jgi:hypothetical protein
MSILEGSAISPRNRVVLWNPKDHYKNVTTAVVSVPGGVAKRTIGILFDSTLTLKLIQHGDGVYLSDDSHPGFVEKILPMYEVEALWIKGETK